MSKVTQSRLLAMAGWQRMWHFGKVATWSGVSFFVSSVIQRLSLARVGNKTYLNADSYSMLPTPPELFKS